MMSLAQLKWNLAFCLQFMEASERLLERAAEKTSDYMLKEYLVRHREEEKGHAAMLMEDLDDFRIQPHPMAIAMAGTAYYAIEHYDPAALLGYMLALEAPFPPEAVAQLEEAYGKSLCRCLRHHAVVDVDHEKELLYMISMQEHDIKRHIANVYHWTREYLGQFHQLLQGVH